LLFIVEERNNNGSRGLEIYDHDAHAAGWRHVTGQTAQKGGFPHHFIML
jgi:hypothetical protein